MVIHLTSKIFTTAPEKRFAREFNVSEVVWRDCWIKYKVLELSIPELCSYIHIVTGRKPSYMSVKRWIIRSEIYAIANTAIKRGAHTVMSSYFGEYEGIVTQELLRHLKTGDTKSVRSLL